MQQITSPLLLLNISEEELVEVHLVDGSIAKGYLVGHDEMINLLLRNVQVSIEGSAVQKLNNVLIRGGNVKFLTKIDLNTIES